MNFLNKLERKFGRYAISNLMAYIIAGQAIIFLLANLIGSSVLDWIYFNPLLIMKGQIWRLVTFIFIPNSFNPIWFLFGCFLYYSIGSALEQTWGAFKFNIYYLCGMIFNMLAIFIVQLLFFPTQEAAFYVYQITSTNITYYLNLSLFLAYAVLFPDIRLLLYGIIPMKIKYLAVFDVALLTLDFINGGLPDRILIIVSLLNFFVFFGPALLGKRPYTTSTQRNFRAAKKQQERVLKQGDPIKVAFHKCTVCGKTELTDPDMEFRYCSKCNGNYEYCMDHLHNHEHKQ